MTISREDIEERYAIRFTDNQWRIVVEEVENKEDFEDVEDVIADTIEDLDFLESEYAWWEAKLAEAREKNI